MNKAAEKYLNSQYGKLSEEIKKAYLAGQNIVYVVSKDYAIVKEVIEKNPIFFVSSRPETEVLGTNVSSLGTKTEENRTVTSQNLFWGLESLKDASPKVPSMYVVTLKSSQLSDPFSISLNTSLKNFTDHLSSLSSKSDNQNFKKSIVLVVTPCVVEVPAEIALYSRIIRVEEPTDDEIKGKIASLVYELDEVKLSEQPGGNNYLDALINSTKGLTLQKIEQIFSRVKYELDNLFFSIASDEFKELNKIVLEEKAKLVENSSILKLVKPSDFKKKISGMASLEHWLEDHRKLVKEPDVSLAEAYISQPKGILLYGIPGTGKSLAAKTTAAALGDLPLLQLDMGSILNKYVGESEHKMEEALKLSEAVSPCVLWVDEIEKAIKGASGGKGANEAMTRIFGKLLTWMQEKEERGICCFVFATANDISEIPPELFRSGRFDEKFYTFMPSWTECIEIFQGQISAQNEAYEKLCKKKGLLVRPLFDAPITDDSFFGEILNSELVLSNRKLTPNDITMSKDYKFMTGSDIEAVIQSAKLKVFNSGSISENDQYVYGADVFKAALKNAISEKRTYGQTNAKEIVSCFAQMAEHNFVPVSGKVVVPFDFLNFQAKEGEPLFTLSSDAVEAHLGNLTSEYDRQLFLYVGIAANMYLKRQANN